MLRSLHPSVAIRPVLLGTRSRQAGTRWRDTVIGFVLMLMTAAGGTVLGLALTTAAVRHGRRIGSVSIGPWSVSPREGTPEINPYQRADFARTGVVPMSAGQGVALNATRDASKHRLRRDCTYTISGSVPRARFWTMGVYDTEGYPLANAAERYAFTSDSVLRDAEGTFSVTLSPDAQPGNWLPLSGTGRFSIVLRLYDSVVPGLGARELAALPVPSITAVGCR